MNNFLDWNKDKNKIISSLQNGEIIAYPTEALYGLGCYWQFAETIQKISALKERSSEQNFLIVAAEWQQISAWVADFCQAPQINSRATTYLYPASVNTPKYLIKDGKIAIRLTNFPFLRELCAANPIISTSANKHGKSPARSASEVAKIFPEIKIIDEKIGGEELPSMIIDYQTGKVLRA